MANAKAPTGEEAANSAGLGGAQRELVRAGDSVSDAAVRLYEAGFPAEALSLLAFSLDKPRAVWWAVLAARAGGKRTPPEVAALDAAERWVKSNSEEHRRDCETAAGAAGVDTPGGCAAMAAFVSGGSLGPAHLQQPVPPDEKLTAKLVAGAILLAAAATVPASAIGPRHRANLGLGIDVLLGRNEPPK